MTTHSDFMKTKAVFAILEIKKENQSSHEDGLVKTLHVPG